MDSEMPDSSTSPTTAANPPTVSKPEPVASTKNDEPPAANEATPVSRTSSPSSEPPQTEKLPTKEQQPQAAKEEKRPQSQQAGEKRKLDADEDEQNRKKKQLREEGSGGVPTQAPPTAAKDPNTSKVGRNVRGGSSERSLTSKVGAAKSRSLAAADRKSPLSVTNSPRKPSSRDHSDSENDDESSKKSSDSTGLKVPPLKIVLTSQGNGNGNGNSNVPSGSVISGQSPASSSEGEQKRNNSSSNESTATSTPEANSSSSLAQGNLNVSYADYHVKKRKLRSQVDDNSSQANVNGGSSAVGSSSSSNQNQSDPNKNIMTSGMSSVGPSISGIPRPSSEPLNDIEKFLNIRRQVEQRRKNLFPVQPKPPQGFKDYLMNRKTYLLHENAHERLRSIPMIQPPPSLEGPLRELFKAQEEERYKLRMKHMVEKEKLVLSVEQEILRVHGRAARALANQSLPYSVCTFLRDEEIYTPIDPQQEEKNRDIRSRYNGRLFLSWLQDVDDKWEKIKEQMVLRHHNEAESLNAVQKMDWEWKVKELSGVNPSTNDTLPPIDDLHIPMVHVSDDFDLDRS